MPRGTGFSLEQEGRKRHTLRMKALRARSNVLRKIHPGPAKQGFSHANLKFLAVSKAFNATIDRRKKERKRIAAMPEGQKKKAAKADARVKRSNSPF